MNSLPAISLTVETRRQCHSIGQAEFALNLAEQNESAARREKRKDRPHYANVYLTKRDRVPAWRELGVMSIIAYGNLFANRIFSVTVLKLYPIFSLKSRRSENQTGIFP
ncbi:hypothetical protein D7X94_10015 [Acutalibacter sp. 1XD8-33]|nr:hypothetical protein D7X94_10015 [Acutalibacter sp. 1XD8-33]